VVIRIDKMLADAGLGTRTEVKKLLRTGTVSVNGSAVKDPGYKVDTVRDSCTVGGRVIGHSEFEYYMLYKPAGVVSAVSDGRDKTVIQLIKEEKRRDLFPVGRLDKDAEGLLLITNDGDLTHRLLSPGMNTEKQYYIRYSGEPMDASDVEAFAAGIDIGDDKPAKPARLELTGDDIADTQLTSDMTADDNSGVAAVLHTAMVTVTEGRFHEVKRLFEARGRHVEYLKRVRMGSLRLDETLSPGEYRRLTAAELNQLKVSDTAAIAD